MTGLCVDLDELRGGDLSAEQACDLAAALGVGGVELRIPGGRPVPHPFRQAPPLDPAAAGRALRERGLSAGLARTALFLCPAAGDAEPDWVAPRGRLARLGVLDHLAMLDAVIRDARLVGAAAVSCHAFWRADDVQALPQEAVDALGEAAERCGREGLRLVLENDHRTRAATGAELAGVIAAVGSPALRAGYDVAEAARRGARPEDDAPACAPVRLRVKSQIVDVRVGWTGGQDRQSFGLWLQPDLPVTGEVRWGSDRVVVAQARNWVCPAATVGVDYGRLLAALPSLDTVAASGDDVIWGVPAPARRQHLAAVLGDLAGLIEDDAA